MSYGVSARPEHVRDYWALFVNRRAHTLQAKRPDPETGRHNYFVAKEFMPGQPPGPPQGAPKSLDDAIVRAHLEGRLTIGLYAICVLCNTSLRRRASMSLWNKVAGVDIFGSFSRNRVLPWSAACSSLISLTG